MPTSGEKPAPIVAASQTDGLGDQPVALYPGRTSHTRKAPFTHQLGYRTLSILIDVDRLDEAHRLCSAFSVERVNLFSFYRRDVGARTDTPLRPWAQAAFAQAGITLNGGRITLLCFPRVLGYVFNPLSMWFGYGPDGQLRGVIYEVHNTFGDAHAYVAPTPTSASKSAPTPAQAPTMAQNSQPIRQHAAKIFHVSPFFADRGHYAFTLRPPHPDYRLTIDYSRDGTALLQAGHVARPTAMTTQNAWSCFLAQPLSTHKAIAGIHFEALRLWMKGAKYHPRPVPPVSVSVASLTVD